jgi:hypothetical protein
MGTFFLHMPLVVVVFPPVGDGGDVVGACTRICIDNPSVNSTWKAWTPGVM